MNTAFPFSAFFILVFVAKLSAQPKDTCGFQVKHRAFDATFPYYALDWVSARENGSGYEYYFQGAFPTLLSQHFRRVTIDKEGGLLSTTDFTFECTAVIVGKDGSFICADSTSTGIRVSKIAEAGDTVWTGIFGQSGFVPRAILDLGTEGIVVAGAEPYAPPYIWFPKGFLLKIGSGQVEEWMTIHNDIGYQGVFSRIVPSSDGGYFVEVDYSANSYAYTWEDGIKFDQNGNFLWQTRLGTFAPSNVIGFTGDADGGLLATAFGLGPNGPSFSCQFFHLDTVGDVLQNDCLTSYMPDNQTYFVNGLSEILPAASGGYLTGMLRTTQVTTAPRYVFVRFDPGLDTLWTKGFDQYVRFSTSLPGDAFLGYWHQYGNDTINFVKIGANGELHPCIPSSTFHPLALYENLIRISPNPAVNEAWVSLNSDFFLAEKADIQLINSSGKMVRQYTCSNVRAIQRKLDLTELPGGWYVLRVILDNGEQISKPILVNR